MKADPSAPNPDPTLSALHLEQLAQVVDAHWDAIRRGEQVAPEAWTLQHPDGAEGIADLRVLEALHDARQIINEDSCSGNGEEGEWRGDGDSLGVLTATTSATPQGDPASPVVGNRIGKYAVKEVLGAGGQATTFKAWDPDLQRTVVVKAYHTGTLASRPEAVLAEGRKLAKVRSPYVIGCHDVETVGATPCLILEYVAGPNLSERHRQSPFKVEAALDLIAKVATGLAAVHARGLLHRDVKPSNIVIGDDGAPKLIDFGLAMPLGDRQLASVSGTFSYMAPEQARGDADHVDSRTDIFGLGATLYFLLTGHAPYEGTPVEVQRAARAGIVIPPRQRNPRVSSVVDQLCMRCLERAPENRFPSASTLAESIRGLARRRVTRTTWEVAMLLGASLCVFWFWSTANNRSGVPGSEATNPLRNAATPDVPVTIDLVRFRQLVRNARGVIEGRGLLFYDPYVLKFGDSVQFRATLSRPAYCYWIAYRPDGVAELCFPDDLRQRPPLTDQPRYPLEEPDDFAYELSDGVGEQAFVLVVSETPLPAYEEWISELPPCPWGASSEVSSVLRHHDGEWEEVFDLSRTGPTRGATRLMPSESSRLSRLVRWIREANDRPMLVEAWSLPVQRVARSSGGE